MRETLRLGGTGFAPLSGRFDHPEELSTMSHLTKIVTALLLATLPVLSGCQQQTTTPPEDPSSINDSGTGNAPNVGDGEPSAASP